MIQGNVEDVSPFFQSTKGYGLYWDNYSPTLFTDNEEETSFRSDVGDCMDYYFMYGGDADGVVAQVRYLTGEVPMFPLWTYGYWQSKERYKSQEETVGVVRKYRELGVLTVLFKIGNIGDTTICGMLWTFRILNSIIPKK